MSEDITKKTDNLSSIKCLRVCKACCLTILSRLIPLAIVMGLPGVIHAQQALEVSRNIAPPIHTSYHKDKSEQSLSNAEYPRAEDITNALVAARSQVQSIPKSTEFTKISPSIQNITDFAIGLTRQPTYLKPVTEWRGLFLIYRNTDTIYTDAAGVKQQFQGGLSDPQVQNLRSCLGIFPELVKRQTSGLVTFRSDIKVVSRPISLSVNAGANDPGFPRPNWTKECLPEKQAFFDPAPYDVVVIIHYPGPVPQSLGGLGGFDGRTAVQNYQYGNDRSWNVTKPAASLGGMVHEWIHGLDGFFGRLGYRLIALHHLVRFKDGYSGGYGYNPDLHTLLLSGRALNFDETRYGFSRAVWLAGTPSMRANSPLPVQLLAPQPGATVASGDIVTLRWNRNDPSGKRKYRVLLYATDRYDKPMKVFETPHGSYQLQTHDMKPGSFVWTVQVEHKSSWSIPGDAFSLNLKAKGEIAKPKFEIRQAPTSETLPPEDYAFPVSVSCIAQTTAIVGLELTYDDGTVCIQSLVKRTLGETDSVWTGNVVFRASENTAKVKVRIIHIDEGGNTTKAEFGQYKYAGQLDFLHGTLRLAQPLNPERHLGGIANPNIAEGTFPSIPADGGNYPIAVLLDSVHERGGGANRKANFIEIVSPSGTVEIAPLLRWDEFNGMLYGLHRFPANISGHPQKWTFKVISDATNHGPDFSKVFAVNQESQQLGANPTSPH